MPNWTKNELTVEGKTKEVRRFLKHMGEGFSFEKIIPLLPKDGDKNWPGLEKSGIENWGTKWDACEVEVRQDGCPEGEYSWVTYPFQTAWDAPHPVIAQLKADWSELSFYGGYVHEGYEGCGTW